MKRDMDLVRQIVFALEDHPHGLAPRLVLEGHTDEQIGYHVYLMIEAGLVKGSKIMHTGSASPDRARHLVDVGGARVRGRRP